MNKIGLGLTAAVLSIALVGCGQQHDDENDTPLTVDEQDWQQYGVDDPRLLDWMDMHNNTRMEVADTLEEQVEQLDRIQDAVVIQTDNNAYVGVKLEGTTADEGIEIPNATRARVILAVKTANSKLRNVYVSGRPEVYRTISSYARKLSNGVTERSLVQSFNTRMQQQFPFSELGQ